MLPRTKLVLKRYLKTAHTKTKSLIIVLMLLGLFISVLRRLRFFWFFAPFIFFREAPVCNRIRSNQ